MEWKGKEYVNAQREMKENDVGRQLAICTNTYMPMIKYILTSK